MTWLVGGSAEAESSVEMRITHLGIFKRDGGGHRNQYLAGLTGEYPF